MADVKGICEKVVRDFVVASESCSLTTKELCEKFKTLALLIYTQEEVARISQNGIASHIGRAMSKSGFKRSLRDGYAIYRGVTLRGA